MSSPDPLKKRLRKAWGWGAEGNEDDPFTKLGKQFTTDAKETLYDLKDEPTEVPYRIRERLRSYFPGMRRR